MWTAVRVLAFMALVGACGSSEPAAPVAETAAAGVESVATTPPLAIDDDSTSTAVAPVQTAAPDPTVAAIPAPVPEPTASPTAVPAATAAPVAAAPETAETSEVSDATAVPTAAPTVIPEPTAVPTAVPEPTAIPTAVPEPTATATAVPEPTATATAILVPQLAGQFSTISGSQIDLGSLQGQDVVLWFWAPW